MLKSSSYTKLSKTPSAPRMGATVWKRIERVTLHAEIYSRGISGESLTGVDLVRFLALVVMYLAWVEDVDSQFEAGLYFQEEEIDDMVDHMSSEIVSYFSTPEVRKW